MALTAGLVGLPNVGKSTLFNTLTASSVPAENFPFCTIDPHIACTPLPDERLERLTTLYGSKKIVPTTMQFVDIAGLVKGAASGEGLGNQFLSHIREVDLIMHVVRCFEDADITNTQQEVNPIADYEIIVTELMLKDLDSVTKRLTKVEHLIKGAQKKPVELQELTEEKAVLNQLIDALNKLDLPAVQELGKLPAARNSFLLTSKPFLIVANISESEVTEQSPTTRAHIQKLYEKFGKDRVLTVSARLEHELSLLPAQEADDMARMMGLSGRQLGTIIRAAYYATGLITFFTCGPQEAHAWTTPRGSTIKSAAGEIHSDLEKGFICAEVFSYDDLVQAGSETKLKELGKLRIEGQHYLVQDGDIIHVRFNKP